MPIHYALHKNEKIAGEDCYVARVHSCGTLSREQMIDRMVQAGTTFTRADLVGMWSLAEETGLNAVLDGWNVTTPFGILWVSVRGVFKSFNDRFDARRHKIVLQFKISARVQKQLDYRAHTKRMEGHDLRPLPVTYLDVCTGRYDRVLTPGRMGRLYGKRLKFDPQDPRQGIFVLGADGSITRVEEVAENKPRTLIFLLPPLPDGLYKLAVRATCGSGQEATVGILDDVLRVAPPDMLLEKPHGAFPTDAMRLLEMGKTPE